MGEQNSRSLWKGVVAGMAGGLAGSWLMMRFIEGPGPRVEESLRRRWAPADEQATKTTSGAESNWATPEARGSVTMQAADTFVNAATGGRHLSYEGKVEGGNLVHYAFGTLLGGVYGTAAEYSGLVGSGAGSTFGTMLWASTDLLTVPAAGFAPPPRDEPASAHVAHWMAHVVYSMSMELTRRCVRAIL